MKEPWINNRERKKQPKQGKYWCSKCDCQLVYDWKRCSNCGHRNGVRRNKK